MAAGRYNDIKSGDQFGHRSFGFTRFITSYFLNIEIGQLHWELADLRFLL